MIRILMILAMLAALPAMATDMIDGLPAVQIDGLRAGRGMGLSMTAELAGKPGPLHVLELSPSLGLTPEQSGIAEGLVAAMKGEAIPMGEEIIRREGELHRLFLANSPDRGRIAEVTDLIARLNGRLRLIHLESHLKMADAMTADQIARYSHLRHHR